MTLQAETNPNSDLKVYQTPVLRDFGTVSELTMTGGTGSPAFPDGVDDVAYVTSGQTY